MQVNSIAPSIVLMFFLKQNHTYNSRNWEKKAEITMKNIGSGKVILNIFKTLETIKRWENKAQEQTIIKQGTANIMHNTCLQRKVFKCTKIARNVYVTVTILLILFQNSFEEKRVSLRSVWLSSQWRSDFFLLTQQLLYSELPVWLGIDKNVHKID